jgi:hypothetical protein
MTAYPAGGPPGTQANYPTVFDPATGAPPGPRHMMPRADIWLGRWVTWEYDADLLPDEDPSTNISPTIDIPNRDAADDGLLHPLLLTDCVTTYISYTISITPGAPTLRHFVNVWFDWNRDGDWADILECPDGTTAPEWAVRNQSLPAMPPGTYVFVTPAFVPYNPNPDDPLWMRISVAEGRAPLVPNANVADGRGPDKGYKYGETEDYYLWPEPDPDYDIYIKDSTTDDGSVPSSSPWWLSPDVWVRNDGDCTNTSGQNPVPGSTTTVCVNVRNRLATTVTNINVDVYWGSAGIGLTWPGSWSYVATFNVPSLTGGASTVQSVTWPVPSIAGHFCLLARADATEDPIGSGPDTVSPVDDVPNNNNIAQTNTSIVDYPEVTGCGFYTTTVMTDHIYFDAINPTSATLSVDIVVDSPDFPLGTGTVTVDPGTAWGRWTTLTGFNQLASTLEVTSFPATMGAIDMTASEMIAMSVQVVAEIDEKFTITIEEQVHSTGESVGGLELVRDLPSCLWLPIVPRDSSPY